MPKKEKAGGGGKLNRSETVTIRLDPKLNYLAELAARVQRRTKSSFIESAVAERIEQQPLTPRNEDRTTIGDMSENLWHVRDYERLIRLAEHAPHLMNFEEQEIWALIAENSMFWWGNWKGLSNGTEVFEWTVTPSRVRRDQVASQWSALVRVAEGTLPASTIPATTNRRPKPQPDPKPTSFGDDDEIPF